MQAETQAGWLDVETKKRWDRRWFAIRGTSLCLHGGGATKLHPRTQPPSSVFPCGACEIVEPKNKRKGHAMSLAADTGAESSESEGEGDMDLTALRDMRPMRGWKRPQYFSPGEMENASPNKPRGRRKKKQSKKKQEKEQAPVDAEKKTAARASVP